MTLKSFLEMEKEAKSISLDEESVLVEEESSVDCEVRFEKLSREGDGVLETVLVGRGKFICSQADRIFFVLLDPDE